MPTNRIIDFPAIKVACQNCRLSSLCLPAGLDVPDVEKLEQLVSHPKPLRRGNHLFRMGDPLTALYAVHSGAIKTYTISVDGQEKVLGFHLPGELLGFDGLGKLRHRCSASALDTTSVCKLPYDRLQELAAQLPSLSRQLQRLMSEEIVQNHAMLLVLSEMSAPERVATFLLNLSERFGQRGLSTQEFYLSMARQDTANYLGITLETASRTFRQLHDDGLIAVERRHVCIRDRVRLEVLAKIRTGPSSSQAT